MPALLARLLAAGLVAFALWRVATAPALPVPVASVALERADGARSDLGDNGAAGTESQPGHHHRSHHGGVVGMAGELHLEALAMSSGRILVYMSDFNRRPLSHDGVSGTVTLDPDDAAQVLPLRVVETATGEGMEARGPELAPGRVQLVFSLDRGGEVVEMEFFLPVLVGARRIGGAVRRCGDRVAATGTPRPLCTLQFEGPVASILAPQDGRLFVASIAGRRPTVWSLPDVRLSSEFRSLPTRLLPRGAGAAPRAAVAMRPDGREAVVALPGTLARYVLPAGVPFGLLPGPVEKASAAAWSADTRRILAADGEVGRLLLINVVQGETVRDLDSGAAVTDLAFAAAGRRAAVARGDGTLTLYDLASGDAALALGSGGAAQRAVVFVGALVGAGGDDGVVRLWEAASGRAVGEIFTPAGVAALAASATGKSLVAGGSDGALRVYAIPALAPVAEHRFHTTGITAVVWAGDVLVSGDAAGTVAVWTAPGG